MHLGQLQNRLQCFFKHLEAGPGIPSSSSLLSRPKRHLSQTAVSIRWAQAAEKLDSRSFPGPPCILVAWTKYTYAMPELEDNSHKWLKPRQHHHPDSSPYHRPAGPLDSSLPWIETEGL
nr:PREDICTED: uncharacterized protein LOC106702661 [Latimeria chalumnae]|eukprot:XP_014341001.1 PREDICTED: uncharacterized protein LOC106702661 [Latimeria chalumnae]